jgi:hypothetical protein
MSKFKGWPVAYLGIVSLSVGSGINSGIDSGLIVAGICLVIVGIGQACSS